MLQFERLLEGIDDQAGQHHRPGRQIGRELQDRKFVAAQPGHDVAAAHARTDPLTDQLEQGVADRMTERIIDRFELVEIETEQRRRLTIRARVGQCSIDLFLE